MRKIELTQGRVALVDDDMYEYLSQWKWYAHKQGAYEHGRKTYWRKSYYAVRKVNINGKRKMLRMHKVIWEYYHPEYIGLIDHADNKDEDSGLNNCIDNLRECSTAENMMNRTKSESFSSQYKGVCWHKLANKWVGSIRAGELLPNRQRKQIHLGCFDDEIEAARAYDRAAIEHFKEFANTNFPIEEYIISS
jgi:hypothetical protein